MVACQVPDLCDAVLCAVRVMYVFTQGYEASKLEQKVLDMDKLDTDGLAAFQSATTVFCALGTTRKVLDWLCHVSVQHSD